jgi:hypothetical protein
MSSKIPPAGPKKIRVRAHERTPRQQRDAQPAPKRSFAELFRSTSKRKGGQR